MKKSNRTVRKMRSAWTGFTTACLAAALTMSALVSCAPQESRPVVTSDDLTPPSAAQEAIAQEAGGGKNYAYYWQAENAEETLQMLREAYEQEVNDAKELIAKGEEAVKAAGYPSLAEAQQAVEARQACALPGFVDSKNEEKTERNAGYLVVSHSGGGMLRQGTRKGIRRTPANRGMRAHWVVKGLDISEDVCHGMCP